MKSRVNGLAHVKDPSAPGLWGDKAFPGSGQGQRDGQTFPWTINRRWQWAEKVTIAFHPSFLMVAARGLLAYRVCSLRFPTETPYARLPVQLQAITPPPCSTLRNKVYIINHLRDPESSPSSWSAQAIQSQLLFFPVYLSLCVFFFFVHSWYRRMWRSVVKHLDRSLF